MFTKAEVLQLAGHLPFEMKSKWKSGAPTVPITVHSQKELAGLCDKGYVGSDGDVLLGWELVSTPSNLFGIPAINSQKYFQQQQQPLVPQQILQSAQQILASGLGYAPSYGVVDWAYASNPVVTEEKTSCDCDFRGPNAWLGCRCGFFKIGESV
jgi:hypothetical protein